MNCKIGDMFIEVKGETRKITLDQLAKTKAVTFYRCVGFAGREGKAVLVAYRYRKYNNADKSQRQHDPSGHTGD